MLFNKKIRCFILFKDLIFIFYDYRTKKISIFSGERAHRWEISTGLSDPIC